MGEGSHRIPCGLQPVEPHLHEGLHDGGECANVVWLLLEEEVLLLEPVEEEADRDVDTDVDLVVELLHAHLGWRARARAAAQG